MIAFACVFLLLCLIGHRIVSDVKLMTLLPLSDEQRKVLGLAALPVRRRITGFLVLPLIGAGATILGLCFPWVFRYGALLRAACGSLCEIAARAGVSWPKTGRMIVQIVEFYIVDTELKRRILSDVIPRLRKEHRRLTNKTSKAA